jgi:hypothetical protein
MMKMVTTLALIGIAAVTNMGIVIKRKRFTSVSANVSSTII